MSDDDIDLERVITDPDYRRKVIDYLNGRQHGRRADNVVALFPALGERTGGRGRGTTPLLRPRDSQR